MIDLHDLTEAVGLLAFGVIFYSATVRVFADRQMLVRTLLTGLVFGAIALGLMLARIQVSPGTYFDARNVPVALIALFEGWPAGLIATLPVIVYRWAGLGGSGTLPGILSVLAAAGAGGLVHWWALRQAGRVRITHAFLLGGITFLTTLLGYAMLGRDGLAKFALTWPHFVLAYVGGIGVLAPLFQNVLERERLYASERRFRALLDETSDAIRIVESDSHRILESNPADSALCGRPREALLGSDSREFWPADARGRERWEEVGLHLNRSGSATAFGLPLHVADGTLRSVDLSCRRVQHGGRRYDILIIRDAGPREALDAARREVDDLRAVTLVANAAAHEINNPLTVIVGSMELLQRRLPAGGPEFKWIDRTIDASQRIREIVGRMTRITRVQASGSFPGVPAMLDIHRSSEDN
ncbi:MAG TPA: LytS/YhcK type 5TM receptor domain-containing protein [Methylomirabilota bacterium]|nr:LytS/YhcK type 5TM receptor domain-containing protein [Methylomirabilota bacterium]